MANLGGALMRVKGLEEVMDFLCAATPDSWLDAVPDNLDTLLIDHANCEKKAASTALSLMYRYVDQPALLQQMSRLAREELRHFEQVLDLMAEVGVEYGQLNSSRYAQGRHREISKQEPQRLVDSLLCGAVVEARSCERFAGVIKMVPRNIADLYISLINSEARHFKGYLKLAEDLNRRNGAYDDLVARARDFLAVDVQLITSPDPQFRFHSGVPS